MAQGQRRHQASPQHRWPLIKAGILDSTAQPVGPLHGLECLLQLAHLVLHLFQAA